MDSRFLKLVVGGILLGTAIFFVPFFLLKIAGMFLIFGLVMWIFKGRRRSHHWGGYADRIRSMSEEEYADFKSKASHGHCGGWRNKMETEKAQS